MWFIINNRLIHNQILTRLFIIKNHRLKMDKILNKVNLSSVPVGIGGGHEDSKIENQQNAKNKFIIEGSAAIFNEGNVFYNPVQQFNRDLSVSVIATFSQIYQKDKLGDRKKIPPQQKQQEEEEPGAEVVEPENNNLNDIKKPGIKYENGLVILEALSATGLRSIRYAKEIPGIKEIIANDLSTVAVESIRKNVQHNDVAHLVRPNHSDAQSLMYQCGGGPNDKRQRYSVIDLDPYGTPTRFLDGAVQSICDGGLLLVTATDMAILCGNTPEACYSKYGTIPLRSKSCHEMAIRILLRCVDSHATRYGRYIKPLLSISADFYIRVFLQVFTSPLACKQSSTKHSMVYQCTGCDTITLQPLCIQKTNNTNNKFLLPTGPFVNGNCEHCGHKHHMGGPIWSAPIHDSNFIEMLLETIDSLPYRENLITHSRLLGMLTVINEELLDIPLYYTIDKMCSILKLEVIPVLKFRSALLHANYRVSFSHASKASIKTDAPITVLWDILRCWAVSHPPKPIHIVDGTPIKTILSKQPHQQYNLTEVHPLANPASRRNAMSRFPINPAANWGPGTRATIMIGGGDGSQTNTKSQRNQNKFKKRKLENKI